MINTLEERKENARAWIKNLKTHPFSKRSKCSFLSSAKPDLRAPFMKLYQDGPFDLLLLKL